MAIFLVTYKDGQVVLNGSAKKGESLDDVIDLARNEVNDGFADSAEVYVDGILYSEFFPEECPEEYDFFMYSGYSY